MEKDIRVRVERDLQALNISRFYLRAGIAAAILLMLIFLSGASLGAALPVVAAPAAQDGTDYPFDFETEVFDDFGDDEYPIETEIPFFEDETPFVFETPFDQVTPEAPTISATFTSTIPPNALLTESAEMGSGQVTPPPSETPGPTITAYLSPTAPTGTPQSTRSVTSKSGGSRVDWGYFSLGFAVPVLIACGVILYLLDRRPDLFRPHR